MFAGGCWNCMRNAGIGKFPLMVQKCELRVASVYNLPRLLWTSSSFNSQKKFEKPAVISKSAVSEDGNPVPKKKKIFVEKILLIGVDNSMTVATKEEAEKLSKRRDLKLVKVADVDKNTKHATYKLMTGTEYFAMNQELKTEKKQIEKKADKSLYLNHTIADNDLHSKLNGALRWLNKCHPVRIVINSDEQSSARVENIVKSIESQLKVAGKITQKVIRSSNAKVYVVPHKSHNPSETAAAAAATEDKDNK